MTDYFLATFLHIHQGIINNRAAGGYLLPKIRITAMPCAHFSNFSLDDDITYFFYIGEIKNYGLNIFLREALTRITGRPHDFIAIVPDILEQYNYKNIIAINPDLASCRERYSERVSCRVPAKDFVTAVCREDEIRDLVEKVAKKQSEVFVYMYESLAEMTLDDIKGVSILGPDKELAKNANNKSFQMKSLKDTVPVVEFKTCSGYDDLIRTCRELFPVWSDGIFVTKEYSAAGIHSTVAGCLEDIESKFDKEDVPYLITRFVPHVYDPTVLGVAAGPDDIYIAGVADQRIEGGNRFTGSTFPSVLSEKIQTELNEYTRKVGAWLAGQGYRGIFGCDYIVTETDEIRFLEINARKQGTTLEFTCTLEQNLPPGSPMLPELEYHAVRHGRLPENAVEPMGNKKGIHWGTYNYKIHEPVVTGGYIPHAVWERESFKKIADNDLVKDYLILEHTGSDLFVTQGSFVARVVALGHDHESVTQGIEQGKKIIELTFKPENE